MSLFKKKSAAEFDGQESQVTGKNRGALLVLLILVGGFAYLYFFTSLIVPHEVPPAVTPVGAPEVKQSMPPKLPAQTPVGAPVAPDAKKAAEVKPVPAAAPAQTVKPAAVAAPSPAAVKPAAAPQAVAKPATPPAPAAAKKEVAAPHKNEPKAVKAVEQKSAKPSQKKAEPKAGKAPAATAVKTVARKKPESYTIVVGEFPSGEEAAAAEAKLAKLGMKPAARQETKKTRNMHRLYFGAYTDYEAYSAALDKLRQAAKGAFGIEKDGKYSLYAGSFSSKERAEKEKKDLLAKGFTLQVQQVVLSLSTVRITVGQFSAKADADRAAAKMKGEGLVVKVIP